MYRCQGWTPALLLTGLFAMQSTLCNAEPPKIGVAASIRPNAEGVIGANSRTLSSGSEIYANETVRTGNVGQANLMFIDNTNSTVDPRQRSCSTSSCTIRSVLRAGLLCKRPAVHSDLIRANKTTAPTSSKLRMGRRHLLSRRS